MKHRLTHRAGATLAVAALATLTIGSIGLPGLAGSAFAAEPVASGSATAVEIAIAGNNTGTGTYAASTDGTTETTSGTKNQVISALSGTDLIPNTAVPAQDVKTSTDSSVGTVRACAGLAGPGAGVIEVGNSGTCLESGNVVDLDAGTLDLTGLKLSNSGVLSQLTTPLQDALKPVLDPLLKALSTGLTTAVESLGNPGLHVGLGAVQATCQATGKNLSGNANLANARVYLKLPAPVGDVTLVDLPVNPGANTDVVTQLGDVVQVILDAVKVELEKALKGYLGPLGIAVDQLDVLRPYLNQLGEQLAPLNQLVSIGLNEQTRTADNQIKVTALNLKVLDAAKPFLDGPLVGLKVGQVGCGPNARTTVPPASDPTLPVNDPNPTTPTSTNGGGPGYTTPHQVTSGIGSLEDGPSTAAWLALAGLTLAGGTVGVLGFRRSLRQP